MIRTIIGYLPDRKPPAVSGIISVPASKSHTIRALLIASFAEGKSRLQRPLVSRDTLSCRRAVEVLGAIVTEEGSDWVVQGFGSLPCARLHPPPSCRSREMSDAPEMPFIDVGNSGTTLYLATALAALGETPVRFDGDEQIRRRSATPLLEALKGLGVQVEASEGGCAPFTVTGPLKAGTISMDCPVSQYLSALLLATPLIAAEGTDSNATHAIPARGARNNFTPQGQTHSAESVQEAHPVLHTTIKINTLNEAPYAGITLDWLDNTGIQYKRNAWKEFVIPAGQSYRTFDTVVPADWSSATFFLVAAAITRGDLVLDGLNYNDSQGDRAVLDMLGSMGCKTEVSKGCVTISGRPMKGRVLNMNATPDALPAMAVAACFAEGETRLVNVPQARMKETDRITVMTSELRKLGMDVEELPDGMIIRGVEPGTCKGAMLEGHNDHRVVMALAVAALGCCGKSHITGAEAVDVTFPDFFTLLETSLDSGGT